MACNPLFSLTTCYERIRDTNTKGAIAAFGQVLGVTVPGLSEKYIHSTQEEICGEMHYDWFALELYNVTEKQYHRGRLCSPSATASQWRLNSLDHAVKSTRSIAVLHDSASSRPYCGGIMHDKKLQRMEMTMTAFVTQLRIGSVPFPQSWSRCQ